MTTYTAVIVEVPHPAITKIPDTEPDAVPALWNGTYEEIDSNFRAVLQHLNTQVSQSTSMWCTVLRSLCDTNRLLLQNHYFNPALEPQGV